MKRSTIIWLIVFLFGIAVLFFLPLVTLFLGRQVFAFPGMMRGFGMMGRGGFGVFTAVGLLFRLAQFGALVLVIVAGVGLISSLIGGRSRPPSAVVPTAPAVTVPPAAPAATDLACPNCGRAVQTDWKLCPYCGQHLQETL